MARPELHSTETILDAARQLVLDGGARAATIDGVVGRSGAPKGSIYHRFGSLDDLYAAMWLRAVRRSQERFVAGLREGDPVESAVAAGLAMLDFAREHPADARLLACLRRTDLLGRAQDAELSERLREADEPVRIAVAALARRLYGRASAANLERTLVAVVDLPLGALRRHLLAGSAPPPALRGQLEGAIRGALDGVAPDGRAVDRAALPPPSLRPMHLEHAALIVDDYDEAIAFFVDALGFELVEDAPAETNDGRAKRWVVVRPPGAATGLLLARADGADQRAAVGGQFAGRVGFFLRVEDFAAAHAGMAAAGVAFVTEPRSEPYGRVAVFLDVAGNRWDLLGPPDGVSAR